MEHSKEAYVTTIKQPESPPPVYHKPSLWDRFLDFLNTFWIVEIFACLVSLTMLAAVLVVLKHYNNGLVDLWEHSWSLNSLVGFLATISEITMAVPLASCISQLKWTWWVMVSSRTITLFRTSMLLFGNTKTIEFVKELQLNHTHSLSLLTVLTPLLFRYKQSQKLTDLDKFDQGSRGALGSVGLLLSRPFK